MHAPNCNGPPEPYVSCARSFATIWCTEMLSDSVMEALATPCTGRLDACAAVVGVGKAVKCTAGAWFVVEGVGVEEDVRVGVGVREVLGVPVLEDVGVLLKGRVGVGDCVGPPSSSFSRRAAPASACPA